MNMKTMKFSTPNGNIYLQQTETGFIASDHKDNFKVNPQFENIKNTVVSKFQDQCKNPMLVVGSNNYLRQNVPLMLLQRYDLYLFFYPNSFNAWVCGMIGMSRTNDNARPVFSYGADQKIDRAIKKCIFEMVAKTQDLENSETYEEIKATNTKEIVWTQKWIYRSPKILLKDVLHLEEYKNSIEQCEAKSVPTNKLFRIVQGGKE